MKELILTLSFMGLFLSTSFAQFDQEPEIKKDETTIEESVDRAIIKIEKFVMSIDIEQIFEEDLPRIIEDITPSQETVDEIENGLRNGVERIKKFDSSKLDDLVEDIEEGVEGVIEEIEDVVCKRKTQKI